MELNFLLKCVFFILIIKEKCSRSLPNKIGYLLGLPTKKLDMIIYYERYVVVQPGAALDARCM